MNFFAKVILGSVAVLLLAAGVVILFRSRESGRVKALIQEAAAWAAQGDAERVAALVDEEFDSDMGGADFAQAEIRRRIRPGVYEILELTSLEVGVEGDEALAKMVVKVQLKEMPLAYPESLHVSLRRREGGWRVVSVRRPDTRRW